jgi:cysteine desulfurase
MKYRYFDHNSTTPLSPEAKSAWLEASETLWLNPSSPYRSAAAVKVRFEAARESLAERLSVESRRILFTSGATEGNNAVIRHWAKILPAAARVGINPTEHPSVIEAAKDFLGERVEWLPLAQDGRVDMAALDRRVRLGELAAVSVMAANNETGVIQPWQTIAELCAEAAIPYHCDASQWVGKMPLYGLGECRYVTACAHKFGGPKGVGFMLLPESEDGCRLLSGGVQAAGHRAGTEHVAAVLAMVAALAHARSQGSNLRDTFVERVSQAIPGARLVGAGAARLWNTVSIIMPQHQSVRWIRLLEKAGFLLSAGSACSTGQSTVSHVLLEMGVDEAAAGRVLRISAGSETTAEDWQALAEALVGTYQLLSDEAKSSTATVISID